jgi:ABC-type sugar transport system ATPase subunit
MAEIRLIDVTRLFHRPSQSDLDAARRAEEREDGQLPRVAALDHLSLTIPDGKTCAILGPSGCGKSTLLRVVAGLDTEYTGDVYYDDRNMRDVPPKDRYIGMVFQNYALYPHFHGHNNLKFFFWVRDAPDAEAEERIRATSEMMGFGFRQLLDRKPGTLSGGQQQRLAIARALVRNPQLFLLDEPLSNLDAKLRMQTRVEIKRLLNRFAITTLYVTHDQEEAVALGDLIAVMRAGRVEQVGPYAELRHHPLNLFVAGFLGSYPMNLAAGMVDGEGNLRLRDALIPLPSGVRSQTRNGQEMTVGVRPEALSLALTSTRTPEMVYIQGEVESIEPDFVRRTQFLRVRTPAGVFVVADTTNEPLALTQRVTVALLVDALYFFDTASEQIIHDKISGRQGDR